LTYIPTKASVRCRSSPPGQLGYRRRPEVAPDHVPAERQRQPAGPIRPPLAEVHDLLQPFVRVGELTLVNQQSSRDGTFPNLVLDLIERHDDVVDRRIEETQREKRRGQLAGNGDADTLERRRSIVSGDDDRPVSIAHARAVRQ
jgi:hypothetical protein